MNVEAPSKLSKLAREHFSAALMSDTKWRKLFTAIGRPSFRQMVAKFIDVEEPHEMSSTPSLACPHAYMDTIEFGPVAFRGIEWLEVPIDLQPVVSPIGYFPLERTEGGTRVIGYRR